MKPETKEKIRIARTTHGESRPATPEYRAWAEMKTRCLNKTATTFPGHGGRGIRICQEWIDSYAAFLSHVGRKPGPSYSIDRINNSGDYVPGNVRWATPSEQSRNRRSNRIIEFGGKRQCLQAWADFLGIKQSTLIERIDKWPIDRALTTRSQREGTDCGNKRYRI